MLIGKVIGNVWATRKEDNLTGLKFLVVQPGISDSQSSNQQPFIAVDRIGAGIGDQVMVTQGTSASYLEIEKKAPIDSLIIGIVDSVDIKSGQEID